MNIRAVDIEGFLKLLQKEIQAGNNWLVCEPVIQKEIPGRFLFYKNEEDASNFCLINEDVYPGLRSLKCEPILQAILPFVDFHRERNDIAYYEIDEVKFDVEYLLRTDPHLNPHFNRDEMPPYMGPDVQPQISNSKITENFRSLIQQLENQGYDTDHFLHLETTMQAGRSNLVEHSFHYLQSEAIIYEHSFVKDIGGFYSLNGISATLYNYVPIDHTVINGINTAELEREMLDVNWDIDGYRFIRDHEPIFQQLCEDPNGRLISVQLFNNIVPPWWDKPDFISRIENELKIYPKMEFPGHTDSDAIYESLKDYRDISTAIKQYSIDEDKEVTGRLKLVDRLVSGQSFPLVAPSGLRKGDPVLLSWDSIAKVLSFFFEGELKIDARHYFDKTLTVQYQSVLNDLRQYPIRQLANETTAQPLIFALLEGFKKSIHLEKTMVPSEHIDKYIVIERPLLNAERSTITPVEKFSSDDLILARFRLNTLAVDFDIDESIGNSTLMLIGQYKGKTLQYEPDGMPTIDTGFRIDTVYNFSPKRDIFSPLRNLNFPNKIVEEIFVQRDVENKLVFLNKHGQVIDIDKVFWNSQEQLITAKKEPVAEKDLLTKLRTNYDKGRAI